jgi:hypothetical protein
MTMATPAALTSDDIPPGSLSEDDLRQRWNQQSDQYNQWESLDSSEQLAWAQALAIRADRHAAALKAQPKGQRPTDKDLYDLAERFNGDTVPAMRRALELWGNPLQGAPAPGENLATALGEADIDHVERLAAIIRKVDGNHSIGAAALAKAILERYSCAFLDAQHAAQSRWGDGLMAGVCVALAVVTAHDDATTWGEIVKSAGINNTLNYAANVNSEEWELAGFGKYAQSELGQGKPYPAPQAGEVGP